jgi:protein O-GlcNAc transferase
MNPQLLLDQAVELFRKGQLAQAESLCARALAEAPGLFQAHYLAGILAGEQGRAAEALAHYDRALSARPDDIEILFNRGNACFALERFDEALADYDAALARYPGLAPAWNNRGNTLKALGRREEALDSYTQVTARDPKALGAWQNRAELLWELRRPEEALAACEAVLLLAPNLAAGWMKRGNALRLLRRPDEALASYDKALALEPQPMTFNNRAILLRDMRRLKEAMESYDLALALAPGFAEGWFNRGTVAWLEYRQLAAAIHDLEQAVTLDPALPGARGFLLHLKMHACDWRDFARQKAQVDEAVREGEPVIEPFAYQAVSASPADLQACAAIFAAYRYPATKAAAFPARGGGRKIRLGYLSGEFHEQATARLMAGLYEAHDREKFELAGFSNGPDDTSPTRARLTAAFDKFVDIRLLADRAAAERVREERIDILVDLNGYFGNNRTGLLAQRAAPLQVNYLGFPGTLGAPYMDYIIADRAVIPDDERPFFTEQVVWLPDCYQANDNKRAIAGDGPGRAECGLPEKAFVFCNFNHSYKFTPDMFAVWMRLVAGVQGSVLWMLESNSLVAANLRRAAEAQGVAGERLVFSPHEPQERHLARLALADLSLDSLPYNAHTTGSDALWAGLPLLTCRGTAFAGRVGASLLRAVGLPELVTQNLEDYEALALALAREPERLALLRRKLEQNRRTAPLFDTPRFARHIETAYRTMWEIHCRGEKPRGFAEAPLN